MASNIWFKQPKDITMSDILFRYNATYRVRGTNNREKRAYNKALDYLILRHRSRISESKKILVKITRIANDNPGDII
jgi:hypothetical protein